jgi:hypothetical protein
LNLLDEKSFLALVMIEIIIPGSLGIQGFTQAIEGMNVGGSP